MSLALRYMFFYGRGVVFVEFAGCWCCLTSWQVAQNGAGQLERWSCSSLPRLASVHLLLYPAALPQGGAESIACWHGQVANTRGEALEKTQSSSGSFIQQQIRADHSREISLYERHHLHK